jgi:hypothetical protein
MFTKPSIQPTLIYSLFAIIGVIDQQTTGNEIVGFDLNEKRPQ